MKKAYGTMTRMTILLFIFNNMIIWLQKLFTYPKEGNEENQDSTDNEHTQEHEERSQLHF